MVLEPRQSKNFRKSAIHFPRSPNPGITRLSSDRERVHIGEIFAFSLFLVAKNQHSTVQLSARLFDQLDSFGVPSHQGCRDNWHK